MKLNRIVVACLLALQSQAFAANVLIYDYHAAGDEATGLAQRLAAAGNTTTTVSLSGGAYSSYTPTGLSGYSQVWDLGANVALTSAQTTAYTNYLNGGGTLFIMGENAGFGPARNASIVSFINALGGGSTGTVTVSSSSATTVNVAFRLANSTSSVTFPAVGLFPSAGAGTCITTNCGGAAWGVGQLANAPTGTVISVLDVNFMQTGFLNNAGYPGTSDFLDNLIAYLVQQAQIAAGGGVLSATVDQNNTPAYGAARVIDGNTALSNLFTGLSANQSRSNAASQTLPLLTGSSVIAAQSVQRDISRIIQARLANNLGMSTGDNFDGDKNFWMKPFGSLADQNDRNGVAGYNANTFGVAIGADAALTRALRIGGAFAYAKSDINGESSVAPQSALVDVYQLIGYGSYSLDDRTEINFQAGIGQNENKGRRQIAFTSSLATSSFSSETVVVGFGLGRTYQLSPVTSLTPSVRLDYTWIKDKAYSETGAGLLNLNVDGRETDALIVGVDGKVAHQLNDQMTVIANLGVGYDTINKQASITSAFAGAPGAAFVTYGIDSSPWLGRGGVGGVYKTKSGLEITARYDAEYRESFLNQTASVKARWAF